MIAVGPLVLTETAVVEKVPATATSTATRETVVSSLACSPAMPTRGEARERAQSATLEKAYQVIAEYSALVSPGQRLLLNGQDFRIAAVSPWTRANSRFLELLVEDDRGL